MIYLCSIRTDCISWKILKILVTFVLVSFAWIFFRAKSIGDAIGIIERIICKPTPWILSNGGIYELGLNVQEMHILVFATIVLLLVDLIRYRGDQSIDVFLIGQNLWFRWLAVISLVLSIYVYGIYGRAYDPQQFIYFQF